METKTHFRKIVDPTYLGSYDLMDDSGAFKNIVLTIKEVKKEEAVNYKGQKEFVGTVYFEESKPMIINNTNVKAIAKACDTPYIEDWVGKKIEITVKKIKAFGEVHDALRVVPNKPTATNAKPIDVVGIKSKLNNCKTEDELKNTYLSLTSQEQANPEIIATKDAMKVKLTPKQ